MKHWKWICLAIAATLLVCVFGALAEPEDTLYLPADLKVIDEQAFMDAESLGKVVIPEGVTEIGSKAFANSGTSEIVFPASLAYIAEDAFEGCGQIRITAPLGSYAYDWSETHGYTVKPEDILLGDFTCEIITGSYVRINGYVGVDTTVIIPEEIEGYTIQAISSDSFKNNTTIEYVYLPDTVTEIEASAFEGCTALIEADIGQGVETIGSYSFCDCKALTNVYLSEKLKIIGEYAFSGCTNLEKALLPDSVTTIKAGAFLNCENMTQFGYPLGLRYIRHEFEESIITGCKKLKQITIPAGVTEIPNDAFAYADYLEYVELPEGLKAIGGLAFAWCPRLKQINFPDGLEWISMGAFFRCTSLESALLPDSVRKIGSGAFAGCENLAEFRYPSGLSEIEGADGAFVMGIFHYCKQLESITVPDGVTILPDTVFSWGDYLLHVDLPATLHTIGDYVFNDCSKLEELYLGYNIKSIGADAFANCPELTIHTEYDAYALQYAKDNDIPYYYLTPDGVNSPSGTLYKGDGFSIYGYARSSVNLTEITATIWDSDGENIIQQVSVNPATANYNLSGTVNTSLLFGNLELGSYRYTLTAKTDVSEEVWANNSFTVVPPPLRMYVSGMNVPDGLVAKDQAFAYSGLIQANYPITNITATVTNTYGVVQYSYSQNPDSLTFNLNNFDGALPVANLGGGGYSFTVSATANGETRTVIQTAFEMVDSTEQLSDADTAKILAFARQSSKREIFNCNTYINAVLGDMDALQITIMALNSPFKWTSGYLQGLIEGNPGINEYAVDLYRKEIVDSIASMNNVADMIPKTTEQKTKEFFIELGMDWNMDILDEMKKDIDNLSEEGLSCLSTIVDGLKDLKTVHKAFNMSADLAEQFAKLYLTAENGMLVIDSIAENSSLYSNNQEFQKAVLITKREYAAFVNQEVNELIVFIGTEFERLTGETFSKTAVNLILGAITEINPINYGLKIGMKLTMLDDVAKDYQSFMIQAQVQMSANDAYKNAFDKVAGGDTSAKAVSTLKVMYSYAGQTTKTLCNTILDFDFLYGNTYPGLYTMINMIENSSITD